MHVIFISRCKGPSIKKTRAVLDRYAMRHGVDTWMSPMTKEGLESIRNALKSNATRNTAVACYINKGIGSMELCWVVGARASFTPDGHVPLHTRAKPPIPDPVWLAQLRRATVLAGLSHDFGKASFNFQNKLRRKEMIGDSIRHEWVSMRLLEKMLASIPTKETPDGEKLLQWCNDAWESLARENLENNAPFHKMPDANFGAGKSAKEALFLAVATHHGLFQPGRGENQGFIAPNAKGHSDRVLSADPPGKKREDHMLGFTRQSGRWSKEDKAGMAKLLARFHKLWLKQSSQYENETQARPLHYWRAVTLVSRACLILADHEVSSRQVGRTEVLRHGSLSPEEKLSGVFANTVRDADPRSKLYLNQSLPYHLANVGERGYFWTGAMFARDLPGLADATRQKLLYEDTPGRFAWQGQATHALLEEQSQRRLPTLVMNMASTGAGKTRMNVKAIAALAPENQPIRIAAGFNLKTLTLQTRDAFTSELDLDPSHVSCLVGDKLSVALHKHPLFKDDENLSEQEGGQEDTDYEVFANEIGLPDWMEKACEHNGKLRGLVGSPVLVSTMDYLIHAGEPGRQGHHGHAMLRLASSDLILDEIDSYDPVSLAAVLRLVQVSGLFGRTVVASSATLPKSIAKALFDAYDSGIKMYSALQNRKEESFRVALLDNTSSSCSTEIFEPSVSIDQSKFDNFYQAFADRKVADLDAEEQSGHAPRRAKIVPDKGDLLTPSANIETDEDKKRTFATKKIYQTSTRSIRELHKNHAWEITDRKGRVRKVSFGLIRVANVKACVDISRLLIVNKFNEKDEYPAMKLAVCPYHSVDLALRRKYKETHLDTILKRSGDWKARLLSNSNWMDDLESLDEDNVVFIVVATPVEEVGRDHDFDWAIIEPSSTASIIQTSGRVNRHRLENVAIETPNIHLLRYNRKAMIHGKNHIANPVFARPGHEHGDHLYPSHDLEDLLGANSITVDTRLRFNRTRQDEGCLFSQQDEESTKRGLQEPLRVIAPAIQMEKSWMVSNYYSEYPLRGQDGKTSFSYKKDEGEWKLYMKVSVATSFGKSGKIKDELKDILLSNIHFRDDTSSVNGLWWLCPSLDRLEDMAREIPFTLRYSALEFQAPRYPDYWIDEKKNPEFDSFAGGY